MQNTETVSQNPRFFSLKWKVMLMLSLILLIINGAFTFISYRNLQKQFEDTRQSTRMQHEQLLSRLVDQSSEHLQQLGSLIPSLPEIREAMAASDPGQLHRAFDNHWSSMQIEMGLDEILFYNASGSLLAGWGNLEDSPIAEDFRRRFVKQVSIEEKPLAYLDCMRGCMQHMMIPVLVRGKYVGALLTSTSLADVVLAFRQISGADIGILVSVSGEKNKTGNFRVLGALQSQVVALSGSSRNFSILEKLPLQGESVSHRMTVNIVRAGDHIYELTRVPMQVVSPPGVVNFVMIVDIAEATAKIRTATLRSVAAGLLGLLISELLLLALLWLPMTRLRRTAETIPLLGQGAFEMVRASIRKDARKHSHSDEIDLLDQTAVALADRLENLQEEVTQRTNALSKLVDELYKEKNFVTGLLDTAQAVILTLNHEGRIMMANGYAQLITGYSQTELIGMDFAERFSSENQVTSHRNDLSQFLGEQGGHLSRECRVKASDGTIRHIIWSHSRLAGRAPEDPVILSVGLDITELRQAEQQVSFLADYDALTGLLNRHRFQEELGKMLDSSTLDGGMGALLCFDVDEFKYVNDTGGHQIGDALLMAIANELQHLTPKPALTARLGGDDFVAAFLPMDAAEAIQMARKINLELGKIQLPGAWRTHKVSACIGIVMFPQYGKTPQELFSNADLAMAQAKEKGRGNWHLYTPDEQLMERIAHRVRWAEKIEQALAEDRFELFYQPIMAIQEKSVSHYEALIRMRERDGSLIMPGEFIGIAESTGLIRAIDHMVLRKAIAKLAELEQECHAVKLSVNLSGRSIEDPVLVDLLKREFHLYGVNPANLILEITETVAVEDFKAARALMQSVKELGCAFALDDFGVGFSSFRYVKLLPVDYIKIDGSFVRNLTQNRDDQVFVKVLVEAAHGFGKKAIAEFVENAEILDLLREFGVDYAQGYYIGRPAKEVGLVSVV